MSDGTKTLLVLARSELRAVHAGQARGFTRGQITYARDLPTAIRWAFLPILVDWSLPSHPEGAALAEFAAQKFWREVRRPPGPLPRHMTSTPVD